MEIEEALKTYLGTKAGLTALVSTRIYPYERPKSVTDLPMVTYSLVSDVKEHTLTGQFEMESPIYQFTAYGTTLSSAKNVANQLKTALCDYQGTLSGIEVQAVLLMNEFCSLESSEDGRQRVYSIDLEFEVNFIKE